jgi:hypothetical protein
MKPLLLILLIAAAGVNQAKAQPLTVYSEFARIDTKSGEVLSPETPREIISPAVVRNGFTSFQVVVQAAPEDKWWLFIGQNPENAFKVTMYKESGEQLQPLDLPIQSQGTAVFWMDVWTDANALVRRVKIEPELNLHDDWVIYPLEARVVDATVAGAAGGVCPLQMTAIPTDVAKLQLRNAEQDGGLAAKLPKDQIDKLRADCGAPQSTAQRFWTEDYLKIRDYLFRLR